MTHSTDARFFADSRDWMVSLGADPAAIAAYDDLMRSVLNALE